MAAREGGPRAHRRALAATLAAFIYALLSVERKSGGHVGPAAPAALFLSPRTLTARLWRPLIPPVHKCSRFTGSPASSSMSTPRQYCRKGLKWKEGSWPAFSRWRWHVSPPRRVRSVAVITPVREPIEVLDFNTLACPVRSGCHSKRGRLPRLRPPTCPFMKRVHFFSCFYLS